MHNAQCTMHDKKKMTPIAEAMEHFGLGEPQKKAKREYIYIIGRVLRLTIKTMVVMVINAKTGYPSPKPREFFREQVSTYYYAEDMALIEVPRALINVHQLHLYTLDAEQSEHFMNLAKKREPMR